MVLILALLLVLILFGAGFAVHLLWIAAAVLLVLWLVGFAIGRVKDRCTVLSLVGHSRPDCDLGSGPIAGVRFAPWVTGDSSTRSRGEM